MVLWQHMGAIKPLLDDPNTQEVMINTPADIWTDAGGAMAPSSLKLAPEQVDAVIAILSNLNNKPDALLLDCRLPGLRIAAARHPIAMRGHAMCIRKHSARKLTVADYLSAGAFTPVTRTRMAGSDTIPEAIAETMANGGDGLVQFFDWAVNARKNLLLSGSTSSGKTTLVGALLDLVPAGDRVITIEDTGELSELHFELPNRVHLESNESIGISIRDLVRLSLRFRPTRIIVGEIRGAEAFDMLNAYNTGHSGGIVTLHADNAIQGLVSLETKIRMAPDAKDLPLASLRAQIAQTFSYVIHAANTPGVVAPRAPVEIIEVTGIKDGFYATRPLYQRFQPNQG